MPGKGLDQFLAIARIVRPQGRHGEVVAELLTDFPARFQTLPRVFLETAGGEAEAVGLERSWPHKGRMVLQLAGVDSIESASRLRGRLVLVPREERVPLPPHHYYVWELRGCSVVREDDGVESQVGTVRDVEATGGVDLLHVETARGEVLVPLAQAICKRIDLAARKIVIDPPEDLLELNE